MPQLLTFNGRSLKTVSGQAGFSDAYYTNVDDAATGERMDVVGGLNASKANQLVPWVNRAVDMVAAAIASFPFDLKNAADADVKDNPAYASLLEDFGRNLYLGAGSLWLTGAAYFIPEANGAGRNITLKFIRTTFMTPLVRGGELWGFRYQENGQPPRDFPKDEIIHIWLPNFDSAARPGPAPVQVALGAASVLLAITSLEASFFNNGGVPVTVFEIPAGTPDPERDRFQSFLNRRLSGVVNAFRNLAVRFGLKPTVIGADIKGMQAPELTDSERDNVAVGLRVPPSVISGKVTDVSNSRADKAFFYENTVIPLFLLMAEQLNKQFFKGMLVKPLTLKPAPERLPIMQEVQLDTGKALELLTGKPVFKVDEARAIMGLGKWGEGDPDTAPATPAPVVVAPGAQPGAAPAMADGEKPAPKEQPAAKAVAQYEQMTRQYAALRKAALDNPGMPVGSAFDDELIECKTKTETRAVLERHYPRPAKNLEPGNDEQRRAMFARLAEDDDSGGGGSQGVPSVDKVTEMLHDKTPGFMGFTSRDKNKVVVVRTNAKPGKHIVHVTTRGTNGQRQTTTHTLHTHSDVHDVFSQLREKGYTIGDTSKSIVYFDDDVTDPAAALLEQGRRIEAAIERAMAELAK